MEANTVHLEDVNQIEHVLVIFYRFFMARPA
jgi:hypothetical protein